MKISEKFKGETITEKKKKIGKPNEEKICKTCLLTMLQAEVHSSMESMWVVVREEGWQGELTSWGIK